MCIRDRCEAYRKQGGQIVEIMTTIENENDAMKALCELKEAGCNALVLFLGNFGPETPETLLAQKFDGPVMPVAAAEEFTEILKSDRGDAYCGMLNCSYNLGIRNVRADVYKRQILAWEAQVISLSSCASRPV